MSAPNEQTALFVADAHFHLEPDPAEQRRVEAFLAFLETARAAADLVLLGDLFDFWFDYPHFRLKGYDDLLQALDRVRDAGCRLHFVGGNHDIWAAGYLHERYGTSPDGATAVLELGGRRVLVSHGDGLLSYDWAYNAFRALVRARPGVLLAKSLHPELLYALSTWLSGRSRAADRDEASRIVAKAQTWLDRQRDPAWDLMVMGHVHHAFTVTSGGRSLTALAGWFDTLGYAVLQQGRLRLADFAVERDPFA
ncbi:MAG: UDP-2,3-diacylglucosamine diphosphatase [Candidatus Krumholzibacteriia bacterium]